MGYLCFPSPGEITLELDGEKIAAVQSYSLRTERAGRLIEAFGEEGPVGVVPGRVQYTLELKRVRILPGTGQLEFYDLSGFNLVIVSPGRRVTYTGCQWMQIAESASVGDTVMEQMTVLACGRTVQQS